MILMKHSACLSCNHTHNQGYEYQLITKTRDSNCSFFGAMTFFMVQFVYNAAVFNSVEKVSTSIECCKENNRLTKVTNHINLCILHV